MERRDDAALLLALKDGNFAAFSELVDRHQRSLINFFYHLCWDRQAAEDCAQEVFLRVYSHLDRYEPQAKFTTFLFKIARNLWIDRVRSLGERVPARSLGPVEILAKEEQQAALQRAIDQLPEEQKAVVILSEIQGLKYQDISAILEVPVGTVKSRMHTAMERLKELLSVAELT